MESIQQLPQSLVNKIAAGEVIERPASVVKELMENAVDAGATRIDVHIAKGGLELIRVTDNGSGIPADQLELAVASHATSKLSTAEDLFNIKSLGFRGEALASIAEVSHFTIQSRTPDSKSGAKLKVVGGQPSEVVPCGCPIGTTIEVSNLFFNTPVRRKFLRTPQTEFGHASEAFTRIALPMPKIQFTMQHNNRNVYNLTGSLGLEDHIVKFLGRDLADNLIYLENDEDSVQLSGYVAHPSHSRSNNRMQYFFLNGRHIRNRALQHAVMEAYRGLLTTGRYPITVLMLTMPPELIDVNVHPTKLEVRFQNSGQLYNQVLSTIRSKFLTTDLTTKVTHDETEPTSAHDSEKTMRSRQKLVDWAKGEVDSWSDRRSGPPQNHTKFDSKRTNKPRKPLELVTLDRSTKPKTEDTPAGRSNNLADQKAKAQSESEVKASNAIQLHNRYLISESKDGLIVVDQHALHERILFEQLRNRVSEGPIETQSLLVPQPVDLLPTEAAIALENRDLLEKIGIKIEPFGGDTVLVSGYPAILANMNPNDVLHAIIEQLQSSEAKLDHNQLVNELLHTISCQAAIKAGDRLSPSEISALLEGRHHINDSHHCPHGRPTTLTFSCEDLDKQFRRI